MKRLFSVIMSLQLILVPVAMAQTSGDQFRANPTPSASTVSYLKQVMGLGIGIIGSNILISCPLGSTQPSIYVFLAGSLGLIGSELFAGRYQNNLKDKKTKDLVMLQEKMSSEGIQGGEFQKETLSTALTDEKELRKFINNRAIWMSGISVLFTAAAIIALIEFLASKNLTAPKPDSAGCSEKSEMNKLLAFAITTAWSWGMGKVNSDGGVITTYGGYVSTLLPYVKSLSKGVTASYNSGVGRMITFGASAGITGWVAGDLWGKLPKVDANIDLMEKQLKKFTEQTNTRDGIDHDSGGTNGGPGNVNPNVLSPKTQIKTLSAGSLAKSCFSSTSGGMDNSPSSCAKPFKVPSPKFDLNMNIPTLNTVAMLGNEMAQAVANGDMEKGLMRAGELSAMAAKVKELKEKVFVEGNKKLIEKGLKPIDIDKESQKMIASMESDFHKVNNMAPPPVTAAAGPVLNMEKESPGLKSTDLASPGSGITQPDALPDSGFSEDVSSLEGPNSNQALRSNHALDDFESTVEDISKAPEVSIFKQLSNRYILNYTKIFNRKSRPEVEQSPDSN